MKDRVKADLHNHLGRYGTFESADGVIDIASERLGENGILGIVNCDDKRYEKFVDSLGYEIINIGNAVYVPKKKILVIKGQEVFCEAHALIFGLPYRKNIERKRLEDALKEATDLGTDKVADHPGYNDGIMWIDNWKNLLHYFDSWEAYNSEAELWIPKLTKRDANEKAIEFYIKNIMIEEDMGICSFSDGHSIREIATSYTWLPFPDIRNAESLNLSLRDGFRKTRQLKYLVRNPSKRGALKHAIDIKLLNKISPGR